MSSKTLEQEFPIHWLVWHNSYDELDQLLKTNGEDKEGLDPRGRTPLHLAVTLGHFESTRVLLRHGANANTENAGYWTALQEAVSTGDPELVQLVLSYQDRQRQSKRNVSIPELLEKLKESPDFYVEMKWEFTSWVPVVSRMCPSDTYRVWKSGSAVRIDTTLLGFDNMKWQRGKRSYIFQGSGNSATVMEVDHDRGEVYAETMELTVSPSDIGLPSEEAVAARLMSPIVTTYIDTDKISFERNKSGIWGWRSDKSETVNGYECKVFGASNVELITKTRTEHLTEQDKKRCKKVNRTPLESFLGVAEEHSKREAGASNGDLMSVMYNPSNITPEEYFNVHIDLGDRDIGRPMDQTTKTQKFKANLWLCESYPLTLQDQVIPIIDLMAANNAHFRKLRDFITLQLPAGFPVKIEIPLFHILNARITFGNIFASEEPIPGVECVRENDEMTCSVDESSFFPPPSYANIGEAHQSRLRDEDDELLQFAIQQSLLEAGTENDQVTFWEALNRSKPTSNNLHSHEDQLLQRAIAESLQSGVISPGSEENPETGPSTTTTQPLPRDTSLDDDLRLALEMSQRELEDTEKRRREEEEELNRIIQLSLTDK
ncbi:ankyrin repeat domain-containing protein 13B-like isoform X2 [Liolophura sinensis]|uniref:ankyrin repeat domain-containing protein 13B-like isoform X2 n=1 Tax=Liolophura sinensis TaxID=3198878 RepID=UPI0031588687